MVLTNSKYHKSTYVCIQFWRIWLNVFVRIFIGFKAIKMVSGVIKKCLVRLQLRPTVRTHCYISAKVKVNI